jgi:putative phage-type endonuclease
MLKYDNMLREDRIKIDYNSDLLDSLIGDFIRLNGTASIVDESVNISAHLHKYGYNISSINIQCRWYILYNEYIKNVTKTMTNTVINEQELMEQLYNDVLCARVKIFEQQEYAIQGTPEWLLQRDKCISASDAAIVSGDNHYDGGTVFDLLKKKCHVEENPFRGNVFTEHGTKYEDVAQQLYYSRVLVPVKEFGLLLHPYLNIGASPDGIRKDGIMLEIKVPKCRNITGIIPKHYWVQQQVQMEVANLYQNDYYECRIEEYIYEEEYKFDTPKIVGSDGLIGSNRLNELNGLNGSIGRRTIDNKIKGMIGCTVNHNLPTTHQKKYDYLYPPMWASDAEQRQWLEETKLGLPAHVEYLKTSYWRLEVESCVRVERDFEWMEKMAPEFRKVWEQIEYHRANGGVELLAEVERRKMAVGGKAAGLSSRSRSKSGGIIWNSDVQKRDMDKRVAEGVVNVNIKKKNVIASAFADDSDVSGNEKEDVVEVEVKVEVGVEICIDIEDQMEMDEMEESMSDRLSKYVFADDSDME